MGDRRTGGGHRPVNEFDIRIYENGLWYGVWVILFESSPTRSLVVRHVKAHDGTQGNERADSLAKKGAKLRFDLMVLTTPKDWFRRLVERYWENRD